MNLHGTVEELVWESDFFALPSAIVRLNPAAPVLAECDFSHWARVQVKLAASHTDELNALQQFGFQLIEGEVDFSLSVPSEGSNPGAEVASEKDIPVLRKMASGVFTQSRFRSPWYAPEAGGRFDAQWTENG